MELYMLEKEQTQKNNKVQKRAGEVPALLFKELLIITKMKSISLILFLALGLFISCTSTEHNKQMLFLDKFITYDSLIFPVPETVHNNANTHISKFKTNDSLCIINLSSGKSDPHLYIYHLKQRKLINVVKFSYKEHIKDFIISDKHMFMLVNNYYDNRSVLYQYDLSKFSIIDSCILFENKHNVYANSLFTNKKEKNRVYFSLQTFKNPQVKFPLVGYYDIEKKETQYFNLWYPFVKDPNNKLYFYNMPFVINDKMILAYASTPYLSQLENNQLKTIKVTSRILDLHFKNNLDNIVDKNFVYDPYIKVITINRKDYFLRGLVPDENIYGTNISILSIYDENFKCVGEQVLEYFRNRESYLQKVFTQKYNDTSNISCYVYNNVLQIRIGTFSVKYKPDTYYYKTLDSLKQRLQLKFNESCNNTMIIDSTSHTNRFCEFVKFLKQKDSTLIKENLIIVSLNVCPPCAIDFLDWFYAKYTLLSQHNSLLITYNSEIDIEKIKDITYKYQDLYKNTFKIERNNLIPYIEMKEPFVYLKEIRNCSATEILYFKVNEIELCKENIKSSQIIINLKN